jgi:hypothetical protein
MPPNSSPEEGNRSSFRNVVFFNALRNARQWIRVQKHSNSNFFLQNSARSPEGHGVVFTLIGNVIVIFRPISRQRPKYAQAITDPVSQEGISMCFAHIHCCVKGTKHAFLTTEESVLCRNHA